MLLPRPEIRMPTRVFSDIEHLSVARHDLADPEVGLARRVPLEAILRMALIGGSERMTAEEARQIGLVGEVVPH